MLTRQHMWPSKIAAIFWRPRGIFHGIKFLPTFHWIFNLTCLGNLSGFIQITGIGTKTFAICKELVQLRLSYNSISMLPYRPFANNAKLMWLDLSHTQIKVMVKLTPLLNKKLQRHKTILMMFLSNEQFLIFGGAQKVCCTLFRLWNVLVFSIKVVVISSCTPLI